MPRDESGAYQDMRFLPHAFESMCICVLSASANLQL